jgi:hypothetical protein
MKMILGPGGRLRAYEHDMGSEIVLLSGGGRVLAKYLKNADITITAGGELIGYGNQLYSVLED